MVLVCGVVNLGRDDKPDVEALRQLVASINRYLGHAEDVTAPLAVEGGPLEVESARSFGTV